MFAMFARFFAMITTYLVMFENFGKGGVSLSEWAAESAGAMADQARINRQADMNLMLKEQKVTEKQLLAASTK